MFSTKLLTFNAILKIKTEFLINFLFLHAFQHSFLRTKIEYTRIIAFNFNIYFLYTYLFVDSYYMYFELI